MAIDNDSDLDLDLYLNRGLDRGFDAIKLNKIVDACRELRKMPGYPYTDDKDLPFVRDLLEEFPCLDLAAEIKQWQIWLLDNQEKVFKKKVNHRSRLRRWCLNAAKWKANNGDYRKQRQPGNSGNSGKPGNKIPQYEFEKERPDKDQTKFEEVW